MVLIYEGRHVYKCKINIIFFYLFILFFFFCCSNEIFWSPDDVTLRQPVLFQCILTTPFKEIDLKGVLGNGIH